MGNLHDCHKHFSTLLQIPGGAVSKYDVVYKSNGERLEETIKHLKGELEETVNRLVDAESVILYIRSLEHTRSGDMLNAVQNYIDKYEIQVSEEDG